MVVARERRVVTPDGYVWFVRRRWARRRPFPLLTRSVELRRQGLDDAPRREWRVRGWRRSGRLMAELTAAIRDGRIDKRRRDPARPRVLTQDAQATAVAARAIARR